MKISSKALVLAALTLILWAILDIGTLNLALSSSSSAALLRPNSVVVSGNYAYITSENSNALEILDVSDPSIPLHKGSIVHGDGGANLFAPNSVAVSGNYAYVTSQLGNNLEIVDVSDPANPVHANTMFHGDNGIDLRRPSYVIANGNYLYVVSRGAGYVLILDLSNPTLPVFVKNISFGFPLAPTSAFISGNYLYVTTLVIGNNGGDMRIYDISDPTTPNYLGGISDGDNGAIINNPGSFYVSGNYAYITSVQGHSLEVVDVSDPTLPVHAGKIVDGDGGAKLLSPRGVFVSGNYAYVAAFVGNAIEIVDVSDPTHPTHKGQFYYPGEVSYPNAVFVSGNYAYTTLFLEDAFDIIDVSNPAAPVLKSKIKNGELVGTPPPAPAKTPVLIIPGVTGTEIFNGSEELWLDSGRNFTDIGDQFMDPLQFNSNLLPINSGLSVGEVIGKPAITFDYTDGLVQEFKNQSYQINTDLFLFPYDWRYGVSTNIVSQLKQKIQDIKTQTGSNKVDVIAHSTGGLIVKKYVMDNPTNHSIDKAIFVGVPNTGAPKAIKVLLQGDNFGIPWLADSEIKKIAANFPVIYALSPSQEYYNNKGSYVRIFNQNLFSSNTQDLNFTESADFLINDHQLNSQAVTEAQNLHTQTFDNLDLRNSGVDVYNIAGCKAGTIGKIVERRVQTILGGIATGYDRPEEVPGDGTVPLESATNLPVDSAKKYYSLTGKHSRMLTQDGTKQQIVNIVSGSDLAIDPKEVSQDISKCALNGKAVSIFSPLDIEIVDQDGNRSGKETDGSILNEIPNADFEIMGEHKFIYLPTDEGQTYTINLQGTGNGTFTLRNADVVNNVTTETEVFSDVPVTTNLKGNLEIGSSNTLSLDTNGDGQIDETVEPDGTAPQEPSLTELLTILKQKVQSLTVTEKLRQNLLKKIDNLEKKIQKKAEQNAKILAKFKNKITKQELKGKLNATDANSITEFLELFEAQSENIVLDPEILTQLKSKIQSLNIKVAQKNDLIKRVEKLENKQKVFNSLSNIEASISKKGQKGKISDVEAQQLLDILTQIEVVI